MLSAPYLGSNELALEQAVLTVDIVETAPETNLDEGIDSASPEPKPEPEPEIVKVATPPPPPPPAPPKEASQVVKIPDLKEPAPEAKAEPEIKQVASLNAPPKRPFRQSPAYKKNKQKRDILRAQLQNLAEQKRRQKKQEAKPKADIDIKAKLEQLRGQALNTQQKRDLPSGISLADKLRDHITKCWNPPPGAAGADTLIVDIIVRLNDKAEVIDVAIKDRARFARDGVFKAAANSARRAIFDCSPLPVPQEGNENWKELEIKFDPRFITRS